MTMTTSPQAVRSLYRSMLREARGFTNYNFRNYFIRRTRDSFRENANLKGEDAIKAINEAKNDLKILHRQNVISNMYDFDKLVIEKV